MGLKDNIYINLKAGDKVTLRNGDVLCFDEYYNKITNAEDSRTNYTDTLKHKHNELLDIIKVERPKTYETIFTEADRNNEDDEELDADDVIDEVIENLEDNLYKFKFKKGNVIKLIINL